jgi:molybdate transport system regulatory protein
MSQNQHKLVGKLALETEFGPFLGDTRIRLLECVEQYGSISQAAKAVPLSYKAAWDAVDAMNNLADEALVVRSTGGRNGGGTRLTDYGRRIVALYRAVEQEYQGALDRLTRHMGEVSEGDVRQFQSLLRRLSVKTSARNQFIGKISGLRDGGVDMEVRIALDPSTEVVAIITRESVENLGLTLGKEICALVKASSLLLFTEGSGRITARNQLWGEISHIHDGPVNAEVTLALPGGKTVTAVVTHGSIEALELAPGKKACAVFKASSVILATT